MKIKEIKLSENDKQELIRLHSTIKDKKIFDRIKAIILLNEGYSKAEVEKILCIPHFLPYNSWIKVRYE